MSNITDVPPRTQKLLDQLKDWCDVERGRRAEIARVLDLPNQAITDWLAGRRQPTAEQILEVQAFLDKHK
jgi:hypothetical protein